jgi:outer membrane protein TolC
VRYREGLSTQVELNDSRLLLQQASANAALAVRNLHVARMRVSLLRDLPLGVGAITIPLSIGGPALSPAPRQMAPQAGNAGAPGGLVRTSAAAAVVPPLP